MPDGVAITAGAGTTVATDDAGASGHVQIIKLAISADGSATVIPADASNGLDVDVTRLPTADNIIGRVKLSDGTDLLLIDASGNAMVNLGVRLDAANDAVVAKLATDAIQNGLTALTPKFAAVNASSSGDNTLIAAVTSKKLRVTGGLLVAAGAVTIRFQSGAAGTYLSGPMALAANGGFPIPFDATGQFETASGELLNLELGGAVQVGGWVKYVEV